MFAYCSAQVSIKQKMAEGENISILSSTHSFVRREKQKTRMFEFLTSNEQGKNTCSFVDLLLKENFKLLSPIQTSLPPTDEPSPRFKSRSKNFFNTKRTFLKLQVLTNISAIPFRRFSFEMS